MTRLEKARLLKCLRTLHAIIIPDVDIYRRVKNHYVKKCVKRVIAIKRRYENVLQM